MLRLASTVAACTIIRCGAGFIGPESLAASPGAFAGAWRSVTPSFLFVRFSVTSTSGETCGVVARLTFSGVAWEGSGQVAGDSLVLRMTNAGSAVPTGTVVAHPSESRTLRVQVRPDSAAPLDLTFVRDG
jgi:hypothetical protein